MSTMAELSQVLDDLKAAASALTSAAEGLIRVYSWPGEDTTAPEQAAAEPEQPTLTLEEVRAVLAEKSVAGHREEVQALIREFGVTRLSDVDPKHYATLKAKAEVL